MNLSSIPNRISRPSNFKCFFSTIPPPCLQLQTLLKTDADNPNSIQSSLISALKWVSSAASLTPYGQQLHCFILKSGLDSNIFILNSLISLYSKTGRLSSAELIFNTSQKLDYVSCNIMLAGYVKHGSLNDARQMFDKMPVKNCVSYTTMIMGLVQNELYQDGIELFREMRLAGVGLGEVTMANVVQAHARIGRGPAKFLHGLTLKLGHDRHVIVSTNLVLLYSLNSCLDEAQALFDNMEEKNVVSCNVMLNGYVKAGSLDFARGFFERILGKDVISWGTIIDGYVQAGRLSEALDLYTRMRQTGLEPNEVMIVDIVSCCGQSAKLVEGRQFHCLAVKMGFNLYRFMQATLIHFYGACREVNNAFSQFEEGNREHVACWNALISGFMRNRMVDEAIWLFRSMNERDVFSWSSIISGCSQNEWFNSAVKIFHEMVAEGFKPNEITMIGLLSSISGLGLLDEGKRAHDYILSNKIPITDNLIAAIIDMYAKCGSINSAMETFYQFRERAVDVSPWNSIICGLAMHGHAEMSLRIFSDLQALKISPNSITFIGVLTACCHAGMVEIGETHFKSMREVYRLEPNIKHYGCMVDLLGRAGRLKEAEELVETMPMRPDVVVWGSLLAACKMHGETEIGERVGWNLARAGPTHGPGRVLLSNIYADAGRWNDAFVVRKEMQAGRLSRSPGCSGVV